MSYTTDPTFHHLNEGTFSYLAVSPAALSFELRIGHRSNSPPVQFNIQTAKDLVPLLQAYIEDHDRRTKAFEPGEE